mmetsp:Transcript_97594/g.284911  ORF Transcript_97594/g.284911 Transcript_97594/m.284911 type:complete len:267 (+) Transcript_97594:665-1465(+)
MALEMADCASRASFKAFLFSALPSSRMVVASSMCEVMVSTIWSALVMSPDSISTVALASSSLAFRSAILSFLSVFEISVLLSSRSHQFLCLSSSFCSSMRWKIIFWIMLLTASKGPDRCAEISCARRSSARELEARADARRSCTACSFGSDVTARKLTGDGGGTGFVGASVRTPVTFAMILIAILIASSSPARVSDLLAHSDFLTVQAFSVCVRVAESASRSARVLFSVPSAVFRASLASPSAVFLAVLELVALLVRSWRAALASS